VGTITEGVNNLLFTRHKGVYGDGKVDMIRAGYGNEFDAWTSFLLVSRCWIYGGLGEAGTGMVSYGTS